GMLTKTGTGTLVLSGDSSSFTGNTNVNLGSTRLDGATLGKITGNQALNIAAGASFGGHGTVGGKAVFADDSTLFGGSGQQLAFSQGLTLGTDSNVDVTLHGGPSTNAIFDVTGDLALNGTLNIAPGSVVGVGVYRIFDYTGDLTANTMTIGTLAEGDQSNYELQTSINHQVNLISNAGRDFFFWDGTAQTGDGSVHGGNGDWNAVDINWTGSDGSVNSNWRDDTFAVFGGAAGDVKI
ncbi:autotransporter-associated beta strand repeat-containing protein, partial [Brucella anthropi]|uniref:autotransporter-associated beta strand repeat-containing protein n=1 Tax=Brucella anthropi TaxID=529 RepID=UPI002361FAFF